MHKYRLCLAILAFLSCTLWAQKTPPVQYINPESGARVVIRHPVDDEKKGTDYSYEIYRYQSGSRFLISDANIHLKAESRRVDERFITSLAQIEALTKQRELRIEWGCRTRQDLLSGKLPDYYPDGEYIIVVSEKENGKPITTLEEYRVIIDTRKNEFDISVAEYGDRFKGKKVLIRAEGEMATARSWQLTIIENNMPILSEPQQFSPTETTEIPFYYTWIPRWKATDTDTHVCTIELTGVDRAGNRFVNRFDYNDTFQPSTYGGIVPSKDGDRFEIAVTQFNPLRLIIGQYRPGSRTFDFKFEYAQNDTTAAITSLAITVSDENKQVLRRINSTSKTNVTWSGKDDADTFVLLSNEKYRFDFALENTQGERYSASGELTTPLVTDMQNNGEEYIRLRGIYYNGYETSVFQRAYLYDNIRALWKIAELANNSFGDYSTLVIRGYANPVTGRSNEKLELERISNARALQVKNVLVQMRVPTDKIEVIGMGGTQDTWAVRYDKTLVRPNATDNFKNRRVEFYLKR